MFSDFGLDARLLEALAQMGFAEPTQIQEAAVPLALNERKDIVAMARTGSGKTVAYLLPILQQLLADASRFALVLVPSRELADQIVRVLAQLTQFVSKEVRFVNIAAKLTDEVKATLLAEPHQIVVATPSTAVEMLRRGRLDEARLGFAVFDEADLLASYGYEDDLKQLRAEVATARPQAWLMSATLGEDIDALKQQWCRSDALTLRLEEPEASNLEQFYVECSEIDKFLLMYVMFKLGLIRGKSLVFTNEIDRAYRLKLFLEQFGIRSAVLNSELPQESRVHIVQQFDRNYFNLLIATDESHLSAAAAAAPGTSGSGGSGGGAKKKRASAAEYGVSRGVDFKGVACVINFDLPPSSRAYVHRVGRTARANHKGMALSFVVPKAEFGQHKVAVSATNKHDEKVLARIKRANADIKPYKFDMKQVDSFRYRMEDAFRSVTRAAVREARVRELKQELLASEALQRHFEENPDDLAALRHDAELHAARTNKELKNIPSYLLPAAARAPQPLYAEPRHAFKRKRGEDLKNKKKKKSKRRKDPLKSFSR